MTLCESPYGNTDSAFAGSTLGSYPTTSPFMNTYPTASSSALMLPRDWSDSFCMPVASMSDPSLPENYDFQSNHLEHTRLPLGIIPSLAGLGIRNVDLDKEADVRDSKFALYTTGNLSPAHGQDSRRHQRTHRTDSVYDALPETHDFNSSQNQQPVYNYGLGSPWTLSSILRATEFSVSNPVSQPDQSLVSVPLLETSASSTLLNVPQIICDGEDDIAWCFEKLSAATGLSVADFAAQLSASAEVTLRRMGAGNDLYIPSSLSLTTNNRSDSLHARVFNDGDESLIWPPLPSEMNLTLPFVDINLRTLDLSWNNDCTGVDPADILPNSQSSQSQLTHNKGDSASSDFGLNLPTLPAPPVPPAHLQDALTMVMHAPPEQSRTATKDEVSSPSEEPYNLPLLKNTTHSRVTHHASDEDAFQSPSSSEYSPFLQPLGSKRNHSSRVTTRRIPQQVDAEMSPMYSNDVNLQHLPPINLGTPVFDAHRGIDLEELKAKAERYRLRNQGREYDKRWLIAFAGKLSKRGELVEEFRCYVAGCKQMNKRRDHILIHVGAHLDQRPFKCLHW